MKGKLIIFSAPSGSGKTTIVQHLLQTIPNLEFSVSVTSRSKRPNEKDRQDYYFLKPEEFRKKIQNNEFLEWEEVYKDQYYGTLRSEVERILNRGKNVVFDVDVKGGLKIKQQYGSDALAVFVNTPSFDEIEKRLRMRSTENEDSLRMRILKAKEEISFSKKFDIILINDKLEETLELAELMVKKFLTNTIR